MNIKKFILHNCLYFTANSLTRVITRLAEEQFQRTGLSPSRAFLMMLVNDKPGKGKKNCASNLIWLRQRLPGLSMIWYTKDILSARPMEKPLWFYATKQVF